MVLSKIFSIAVKVDPSAAKKAIMVGQDVAKSIEASSKVLKNVPPDGVKSTAEHKPFHKVSIGDVNIETETPWFLFGLTCFGISYCTHSFMDLQLKQADLDLKSEDLRSKQLDNDVKEKQLKNKRGSWPSLW